jgi:hypothetical protein
MFKRSPGQALGIDTKFHKVSGKLARDSWELICHRAPFTVACRRRLFKKEPDPTSMRRERIRVKKLRKRMSKYKEIRAIWRKSNPLSWFLISSLPPSVLHRRSRKMVLAKDSWNERSLCSDMSSSDNISGQDTDGYFGEETDDVLEFGSTESESDESSIKSVTNVGSSNSEKDCISESLEFATTESDQEAYDTNSSEDLKSEDDAWVDAILNAKPAPLQSDYGSRITIQQQKVRAFCDSCNGLCPRKWYHCVKCKKGNVDICSRCKSKGMWCLDVKHQLYKVVTGVPRMVVSRRNFSICQELAAFRTDPEGNETAAFRFKEKYPMFLHDSPPIIHNVHPLVVWALTGSCLVFGDLAKNKCFKQRIRTASSKKGKFIESIDTI